MKKLLVLAFAGLLFAACSGDDDNSGSGNLPLLKKMVQKSYSGGILGITGNFEFSHGKMSKLSMYNLNNALTYYAVYTYTNGLATQLKSYDGNNTLVSSFEYTYDSQNRISDVSGTNEGYTVTIHNTFNTDNTIKSVRTGTMQIPGETTFYVNDNGLVYKEVSDNFTHEVTYDGFNPSSSSGTYGAASYTYDNEHPVPAFFLEAMNVAGDYKPNAILTGSSLQDKETSFITKFMKNETVGSSLIEYNYTYNEKGWPTHLTRVNNGTTDSEIDYYYE